MGVTVPNFSNADSTAIDTFIKGAKTYYDINFFVGEDGITYKNAIPQMIAALQTRVNANPATTMEEVNMDYTNVEKQIEIAKSDLEGSKTRVETLRKPYEQSYYESWFPINRPLKQTSLFVILGIGIFLFIFSFMLFLRTIGVQIDMSLAAPPRILIILSELFPWQSLILIAILLIIATLALLRKI